MKKTEKLNKLDMALHQLDTAIISLIKNDPISAITLAGAAEEILGKLVTDRSNAYEILRSELSEKYKLCEKLTGKALNKTRNWLKHHSVDDPFEIEIDPEQEAVQYIARAITNLIQYDNTLPSQFLAFVNWQATNRPDLEST